jgi:hypothetical protein
MGCIDCGSENIYNIKRQLCQKCYQKARKRSGGFKPYLESDPSVRKHANRGEVHFIKNFFNHTNWKYQPVVFYLSDGTKYTPDFYDAERNVFIEVASTRQAYHENHKKYELFKLEFSKILLEVRDPLGRMVEKLEYGEKWDFQLYHKQTQIN